MENSTGHKQGNGMVKTRTEFTVSDKYGGKTLISLDAAIEWLKSNNWEDNPEVTVRFNGGVCSHCGLCLADVYPGDCNSEYCEKIFDDG